MAVPTPDQILWMQEHIDETRVPGIHISNGICLAASTISVVLRFISRRTGGFGLGNDDYCLFFGYIMYLLYVISFSFSTRYGQGRHVLLVTNIRAFAINNLLDMSFYVWGISFIKYSILFQYHRIFPSKQFHKVLYLLAAIVTSWALSAFFASIFNCYPVESSWDTMIQGRCIDYGMVTLVIGIINIFIDFSMLAAPMPLLWKLQMSTRRKVFLSGAFAAGSTAFVVSIARLFYAREVIVTWDSSWDNVMVGILSQLEMCTAIVAGCSITYRPLIERVFRLGGTSKGTGVSATAKSREGWSKINVQHDIVMVSDARKQHPSREPDEERLRDWELQTRGVDGSWK